MMPSVLVTGSNRGLGLEWCRQYAGAGWRVFATCRQPDAAEELQALANRQPQLSVHRLDVIQPESLAELCAELGHEAVDVLVNNAGVYYEKFLRPETLDYDTWMQTLDVNTLGPMRVAEAFAAQIARSQRRLIVNLTSHMGSIADIEAPGDTYYRSSKAALNAAMKGLSIALKERGIGVLLLHPGWVKTRMGGSEAPLEPAESVAGMRSLVERFKMDKTGRFFRYNDTEIPW
jgi:NAD(P)-dependent dehydrogenase (short-subunit alcohol dehydrogenase family)